MHVKQTRKPSQGWKTVCVHRLVCVRSVCVRLPAVIHPFVLTTAAKWLSGGGANVLLSFTLKAPGLLWHHMGGGESVNVSRLPLMWRVSQRGGDGCWTPNRQKHSTQFRRDQS